MIHQNVFLLKSSKSSSPLPSFPALLSLHLFCLSSSFLYWQAKELEGKEGSRGSLKRSHNLGGFAEPPHCHPQPDSVHSSTHSSPSCTTQEVVELWVAELWVAELCVAELCGAVIMASTVNFYFGYCWLPSSPCCISPKGVARLTCHPIVSHLHLALGSRTGPEPACRLCSPSQPRGLTLALPFNPARHQRKDPYSKSSTPPCVPTGSAPAHNFKPSRAVQMQVFFCGTFVQTVIVRMFCVPLGVLVQYLHFGKTQLFSPRSQESPVSSQKQPGNSPANLPASTHPAQQPTEKLSPRLLLERDTEALFNASFLLLDF